MGKKGGIIGGITGGGIGAGIGGLLGGGKASHSPRTPRQLAGYGQFQQGFNAIDALLMPVDELLKNGLIDAGSLPGYKGLQAGQSRFGRAVENYQDQLASADPIFGQYRKTVEAGLRGIENGGIPDDLRRSITENLRSAQASRGILDSNTAAIEEVVRLAGGQEAIRAQRLGEAQNYFGQVTNNVARMFAPSLQSYLQAQFGAGELNLGRAQISADMTKDIMSGARDTAGGIGGLLTSLI